MTEMKGCSLVSPVLTLTLSIIHRQHHRALECVAAVHASCAQVYMCVINLFAYISKSVYAHVCIVCINIPSVNLSALMCTMCLCTKCVLFLYVCCMHVFWCVCVCMCIVCLYMQCVLLVAHLVLLCCAAQPAL